MLTNGDVDHIIGLINLREAQPFAIYGSDRVLDIVKSNTVFQVLAEPLVPRIALPLDKPTPLKGAKVDLGLDVEAFAVPGKVALYLEDAAAGADLGTPRGRHHRPQGYRSVEQARHSSTFRAAPTIDEALAGASKAPPSSSSTARFSPTKK